MIICSAPLAWLLRSFGIIALVALLFGSSLEASAAPPPDGNAAPRIALDPASGPCSTRVAVYGSGFTPDVAAQFVLTRDRDGAVTAANSQGGGQRVASDGTFTMVIPLVGCGPDEPIGSTFTIAIFEYRPDGSPSRGPVASATFTVAAPGALPGLPNTGGGGAQRHAIPAPDSPVIGGVLAVLGVGLLGHGRLRRPMRGRQRPPRPGPDPAK